MTDRTDTTTCLNIPMTRINVVPVQELTDLHLLAEYRELPRVFRLAHAAFMRGEKHNDPRNPREYTLGPGHVRFFYPRLLFLRNRFHQIVPEMIARGFDPAYREVPAHYVIMPREWAQDYVPTELALNLNRARIQERLRGHEFTSDSVGVSDV